MSCFLCALAKNSIRRHCKFEGRTEVLFNVYWSETGGGRGGLRLLPTNCLYLPHTICLFLPFTQPSACGFSHVDHVLSTVCRLIKSSLMPYPPPPHTPSPRAQSERNRAAPSLLCRSKVVGVNRDSRSAAPHPDSTHGSIVFTRVVSTGALGGARPPARIRRRSEVLTR